MILPLIVVVFIVVYYISWGELVGQYRDKDNIVSVSLS